MAYLLTFVTALVLTNVLGMNLFVAALVSVVGWGVVGALFSAIAAAAGGPAAPGTEPEK